MHQFFSSSSKVTLDFYPIRIRKFSSSFIPSCISSLQFLLLSAYPTYILSWLHCCGSSDNHRVRVSQHVHGIPAEITNWLPEGLHHFLPSQVEPNLKKLALAGHSRGGKAAFALILGKVANVSAKLKFSALIGIDPVDGMDKGNQTPPPVLTYIPHSFNLDMAVLVIGSGLGEVKKNPLFPACAPKGVNHRDFYNKCCRPACYFVAKDYGHVDMLDDETKRVRGKVTYCLCKNGKSREPMRRFVGGIAVAFLKAYLEGNSSDLVAIKDGHVTLPVDLQDVDFLV